MIYITKKQSSIGVHWACGHEAPSLHPDDIDVMYIKGDSLEIVRQKFSNIPMTKEDKVAFSGDTAKFIFLNLKEIYKT